MKDKPSICCRQLCPVKDTKHTSRMDFKLAFFAYVDLCSCSDLKLTKLRGLTNVQCASILHKDLPRTGRCLCQENIL